MSKRNIKLVVEYDGADFSGWQSQPGARTVQDVIRDAIEAVTGERVKLTGAGRTDAGVSAKAQVANFLTSSRLPVAKLRDALNANLPCDVAIREAEEVAADFHACYCARWKTYRYTIHNSPVRSPLRRRFAHWLRFPLDVGRMAEAAEVLVGKHDFRSFQTGPARRSSVRTVKRIAVWREDELVHVEIEASGFLYNMARAMAGALVRVGLGKLSPAGLRAMLEASDRRRGPTNLPPNGLCLMEVKY